MSRIDRLLSKEQIQVIDTVENWETAVEIASQPLLKNKMIAHTYLDNMIKSVEEHGPYMVLTDYFALMHAKPGVGVNEQSMSLLVVKNAVDMKAKAVKIFLILAAKDSDSHLEKLQEIMSIFMDEAKYQTILSGNKEKIIQLLT
ncbi:MULTISPECIES: PTS sugar transporter subunit IIA [unclassified Enterococcus]|uniref:PTS sugar transporter subunit IIA n=1 Tax=unclassified Enterococcus TaxID=2608891 RepID=UPI001A9B29AF|nr:PTS sugar transporter subunit IIA [Enterococcus sp. DIV1271a]MBO1300414.1 PTS sugar transporter subunit IIA [Enterococcus sp. DIV1271a]